MPSRMSCSLTKTSRHPTRPRSAAGSARRRRSRRPGPGASPAARRALRVVAASSSAVTAADVVDARSGCGGSPRRRRPAGPGRSPPRSSRCRRAPTRRARPRRRARPLRPARARRRCRPSARRDLPALGRIGVQVPFGQPHAADVHASGPADASASPSTNSVEPPPMSTTRYGGGSDPGSAASSDGGAGEGQRPLLVPADDLRRSTPSDGRDPGRRSRPGWSRRGWRRSRRTAARRSPASRAASAYSRAGRERPLQRGSGAAGRWRPRPSPRRTIRMLAHARRRAAPVAGRRRR